MGTQLTNKTGLNQLQDCNKLYFIVVDISWAIFNQVCSVPTKCAAFGWGINNQDEVELDAEEIITSG